MSLEGFSRWAATQYSTPDAALTGLKELYKQEKSESSGQEPPQNVTDKQAMVFFQTKFKQAQSESKTPSASLLKNLQAKLDIFKTTLKEPSEEKRTTLKTITKIFTSTSQIQENDIKNTEKKLKEAQKELFVAKRKDDPSFSEKAHFADFAALLPTALETMSRPEREEVLSMLRQSELMKQLFKAENQDQLHTLQTVCKHLYEHGHLGQALPTKPNFSPDVEKAITQGIKEAMQDSLTKVQIAPKSASKKASSSEPTLKIVQQKVEPLARLQWVQPLMADAASQVLMAQFPAETKEPGTKEALVRKITADLQASPEKEVKLSILNTVATGMSGVPATRPTSAPKSAPAVQTAPLTPESKASLREDLGIVKTRLDIIIGRTKNLPLISLRQLADAASTSDEALTTFNQKFVEVMKGFQNVALNRDNPLFHPTIKDYLKKITGADLPIGTSTPGQAPPLEEVGDREIPLDEARKKLGEFEKSNDSSLGLLGFAAKQLDTTYPEDVEAFHESLMNYFEELGTRGNDALALFRSKNPVIAAYHDQLTGERSIRQSFQRIQKELEQAGATALLSNMKTLFANISTQPINEELLDSVNNQLKDELLALHANNPTLVLKIVDAKNTFVHSWAEKFVPELFTEPPLSNEDDQRVREFTKGFHEEVTACLKRNKSPKFSPQLDALFKGIVQSSEPLTLAKIGSFKTGLSDLLHQMDQTDLRSFSALFTQSPLMKQFIEENCADILQKHEQEKLEQFKALFSEIETAFQANRLSSGLPALQQNVQKALANLQAGTITSEAFVAQIKSQLNTLKRIDPKGFDFLVMQEREDNKLVRDFVKIISPELLKPSKGLYDELEEMASQDEAARKNTADRLLKELEDELK